MPEIEFSIHAKEMLSERGILEEWVWQTITAPDTQELGPDENRHYLKAIIENDGRILRVVVNIKKAPPRIVTVFFDRRLRKAK